MALTPLSILSAAASLSHQCNFFFVLGVFLGLISITYLIFGAEKVSSFSDQPCLTHVLALSLHSHWSIHLHLIPCPLFSCLEALQGDALVFSVGS